MDVIEYYKALSDSAREILDESLLRGASRLAESHQIASDMAKWLDVLKERPEVVMLHSATREMQFSILAALSGQYRHAYVGLRSFLEQALASCLFSAKEIDFRLWERDEKDSRWSEITDMEEGVFSKLYARAFFADLEPEQATMHSLAKEVYRECSQYVHVNYSTHEDLPSQLKYDETILNEWFERATTVYFVVSYALCLRHLRFISRESLIELESVILESVGTFPTIRQIYTP